MDVQQKNQNNLVYAFPRGENEEIRFTIREYENRFYIDLRIWFQPENGQGEMKPTRKGLWVRPDQIGELEKGIRELASAASGINSKPKQFVPRMEKTSNYKSR